MVQIHKALPSKHQNQANHRLLIEELYQNDEEIKSNSKCSLVKLNEWDPKIKKLFRNVPSYGGCMKNEPLTYIKNYIL